MNKKRFLFIIIILILVVSSCGQKDKSQECELISVLGYDDVYYKKHQIDIVVENENKNFSFLNLFEVSEKASYKVYGILDQELELNETVLEEKNNYFIVKVIAENNIISKSYNLLIYRKKIYSINYENGLENYQILTTEEKPAPKNAKENTDYLFIIKKLNPSISFYVKVNGENLLPENEVYRIEEIKSDKTIEIFTYTTTFDINFPKYSQREEYNIENIDDEIIFEDKIVKEYNSSYSFNVIIKANYKVINESEPAFIVHDGEELVQELRCIPGTCYYSLKEIKKDYNITINTDNISLK